MAYFSSCCFYNNDSVCCQKCLRIFAVLSYHPGAGANKWDFQIQQKEYIVGHFRSDQIRQILHKRKVFFLFFSQEKLSFCTKTDPPPHHPARQRTCGFLYSSYCSSSTRGSLLKFLYANPPMTATDTTATVTAAGITPQRGRFTSVSS